jgi:hypothetical protein
MLEKDLASLDETEEKSGKVSNGFYVPFDEKR